MVGLLLQDFIYLKTIMKRPRLKKGQLWKTYDPQDGQWFVEKIITTSPLVAVVTKVFGWPCSVGDRVEYYFNDDFLSDVHTITPYLDFTSYYAAVREIN